AVARFPPGQQDPRLYLILLGPEKTQTRIGLGALRGRMELANLAVPSAPHVVALGKPPQEAGAWVVRLDVCFGLVRAKAWRQGDPEPPNWQSTRYRGTTLWQPTLVGIGTDKRGTVHLESLSVRGSALPPVPPPEQRQKVEQAGKLAREGMAFFRQ